MLCPLTPYYKIMYGGKDKYTNEQRKKAYSLRKAGLGYEKIAKRMKLKKKQIARRLIEQYKNRFKPEEVEESNIAKGIKILYKELGKDIIPLQKSIPPYMPVKKGYGYQGVTLYSQSQDRVQCHVCGLWLKALKNHLKAHKIGSVEYRNKFGLYKYEPLTALGLRRALTITSKRSYKKRIKNGEEPFYKKARIHGKPKILPKEWGTQKMQFRNKHGTCDAQLCFRYSETKRKLGREPKSTELDCYPTIWKRFGTLAKFKKFYNEKI